MTTASLATVDRVSITTVVDNSIDNLRVDEKVARRFTQARARKMPTLRAEHGLGHWVEVSRGPDVQTIAFDWGLTGDGYCHNLVELGLDPARVDALALSHGHQDHFGGLSGFLATYRRAMKRGLVFHGGADHFLPRYNERGGERVYIGQLRRDELTRQDLDVRVVTVPTMLAEGAL